MAALCLAALDSGTAFAQQLQYDRTTFVHGFHDGPNRFIEPGTDTILMRSVFLGANYRRDANVVHLDGRATIATQSGQLRDWYIGSSGSHVVLGLSMGGVVARKTYLDNPANIAALVTIGSPHRGAVIADNAAMAGRDGLSLVKTFFYSIAELFTPTVGIVSAAIQALLYWLVSLVVDKHIKPYVDNLVGNSPALADLKTTSPSITALKDRADNAPHANVVSSIGTRNAVFRMAYSALYRDGNFDRDMRRKNTLKSAVKVCRQIGYNWLIKTAAGRFCHRVDGAIGSIDGRWVRWALNGNGRLPFDGLIPNRDQMYPGIAVNAPGHFIAEGANHMNLQYDGRSTPRIVDAMIFVGMSRAVIN